MPKSIKFFFAIFTAIFFVGLLNNSHAQSKIIAKLDFDPKVNGFSFKNYPNTGDQWKDDIGADDLIRMFGVKEVCKNQSAKNCVLEAAAQKWMEKKLAAMNIGHCEGIAVASLRMNSNLAFKKRISAANFQNGVKMPFGLRLDQSLENYISYYWITQTFKEIKDDTTKTVAGERGPVDIVKMLISSMNDRQDTYLLRLWKYDKDKPFDDGHSVTPFAVEDAGNQYIIEVYDNNYPGETRHIYVNKTGTQQWTYNSKSDPKAKPDYVGYAGTKSLQITATSWRDNRCFDPTFAKDEEKSTGCGVETSRINQPIFTNASFKPSTFLADEDGEEAEFFLTGEGNMLVTDGDGKRLGYDPNNRFYNEVQGGDFNLLIGGLGIDLPQYYVPYEDTGNPYKIAFSGKNLTTESDFDFVFSAPGFTVGFDGIRLDPNETLIATVSHDGEQITFTASDDGETPEVFFAFDPDEDENASYITLIGGVELTAGKKLTYDFDFENGKLFFTDDDGSQDDYDIELIRINEDGTRQIFKDNNLNIGKSDKYEMDFGDWDGKGQMCFKEDDEGDGFDDEQCVEETNETDG